MQGEVDWVLNDEKTLVSIPTDTPWETVFTLATLYGASHVLGILPAISQIEQRLHRAVQKLSIPLLAIPPQQIQAIPALLEQIPIGGIILPFANLAEVQSLCRGTRLYYQAYLGPRDMPTTPIGEVYLEVHTLPGIVALFQCETLAHRKKNEFHQSLGVEPLMPIRAQGTCVCGKEIVHYE
ncbi:hypothetical protein KW798_02035 [Candidatus Parcubacteria bacterium]|nr:hypothetical protein [Candidatus Parcubacteria bacterium]